MNQSLVLVVITIVLNCVTTGNFTPGASEGRVNIECPPGEYESNDICHKCSNHEEYCEESEACCGSEFLECNLYLGQCQCVRGFTWNPHKSLCVDNDDKIDYKALAIIFVPIIIVFAIILPIILVLARKFGYLNKLDCHLARKDRGSATPRGHAISTTSLQPRAASAVPADLASRQQAPPTAALPANDVSTSLAQDQPPLYSQVQATMLVPPPNYNEATRLPSFNAMPN